MTSCCWEMAIILRLEIIINKRLFVNLDCRGRRASLCANENFEISCTPAREDQVKAHNISSHLTMILNAAGWVVLVGTTTESWADGKMNTPIRSLLLILYSWPICLFCSNLWMTGSMNLLIIDCDIPNILLTMEWIGNHTSYTRVLLLFICSIQNSISNQIDFFFTILFILWIKVWVGRED